MTWRAARAFPALAVVGVLAFSQVADAADPTVIEHLRKEPTTLFDIGMKRLRAAALDAAARINARQDGHAAARVRYEPEPQIIGIRFEVTGSAVDLTPRVCQEFRAAVIRDTFAVNRTVFSGDLSFTERIRRRLGLIFAHEPVGSGIEHIAIGQRLAEVTVVEVVLARPDGGGRVSCRGSLVAPDRRQ